MITDSSTLILLAKCGLLDLFIKRLYLEIPNKVKDESTIVKDTFDSKLITKRIKEHKIHVSKINNLLFYNNLLRDFNFGKGEAEAITLAFEKKETLLIDDKKAINACKILGIKFITALNVLVMLYKNKTINFETAKIILKKLMEYGRYSKELIRKVEEDLK